MHTSSSDHALTPEECTPIPEHIALDTDEIPGARELLEAVACADEKAMIASLRNSIFPGDGAMGYAVQLIAEEGLGDLFLSLAEEGRDLLHSRDRRLQEALYHECVAVILADLLEEGILAAMSLPWSLNYVAGKRKPLPCESRCRHRTLVSDNRPHCMCAGQEMHLRPACEPKRGWSHRRR